MPYDYEPTNGKRRRDAASDHAWLWVLAAAAVVLAVFILLAPMYGSVTKQTVRIDRLEMDNKLQQQMITDLGKKVHGLASSKVP